MSNTTSLSQNTSRYASKLKYTPGNNILVANTQPIGSLTIDQTKDGIDYPNIQSAIDDLTALTILPLDTVVTNTSGISPAGVQQADEYTFTGTVSVEGKSAGDVVKFNCFGFYTDVLVGDTADQVATKVITTLKLAAQNGVVFNTVNVGSQLFIIQVLYNDTQPHKLEGYVDIGIKIEVATISPPKHGYGVWTRIGTQTITLDGSSEPVVLYYFRRDA